MDAYDVLAYKKDFLKGVKGFILDFDGTLVDSMPFWHTRTRPDPAVYPNFHDFMSFHYGEDIAPKPYAVEFLRFLKENGIKVCICSDTPRKVSEPFFKKHPEFDELALFYLGSDEVGSSKYDSPKLYTEAASRMGLSVDECCVMEDYLSSSTMAKSGGFKVIAVYDDVSRDDMFALKHLCEGYVYNFQKLYMGF